VRNPHHHRRRNPGTPPIKPPPNSQRRKTQIIGRWRHNEHVGSSKPGFQKPLQKSTIYRTVLWFGRHHALVRNAIARELFRRVLIARQIRRRVFRVLFVIATGTNQQSAIAGSVAKLGAGFRFLNGLEFGTISGRIELLAKLARTGVEIPKTFGVRKIIIQARDDGLVDASALCFGR